MKHIALSIRADHAEIDPPFTHDLFNRKKLSDILTGYVDRLGAGAVIGISAPWGEGKTWFGKNWCASLRSDHKVAFIDAFENDYIDDPFLLIASELAQLLEDDRAESSIPLRRKAASVFRAIMPLGTKALINLAGRALIGSQDLSKSIEDAGTRISDDVADKGAKWLEDRFDALSAERDSLRSFKKTLSDAIAKSEKPLVVFIDELDRCKPSFAVTLIERLKHLFDVPNLVFVLLMNRGQLERSIEGHYGPGTDGNAYLGKFINLWFDLPRASLTQNEHDQRYETFTLKILRQYNLQESMDPVLQDFINGSVLWSKTWKMSLRDIERMCTLFVLGGAQTSQLLCYLIARKVKNPDQFSRLRMLDTETHIACSEELKALCSPVGISEERWPDMLFLGLSELHLLACERIPAEEAKVLSKHGRELFGSRFHNPKSSFLTGCGKLDLPIEPV